MSDFAVAVRVLSSAGAERIDFDSDELGLGVVTVQEPEDNYREVRATADRIPGSSLIASVPDDGFLVVMVRVKGATWADCTARWEAARVAYRAEDRFFIETVIEGVTKRWIAERPSVTPAAIESASLISKRLTYQLRFRVQPNPTVSIA